MFVLSKEGHLLIPCCYLTRRLWFNKARIDEKCKNSRFTNFDFNFS